MRSVLLVGADIILRSPLERDLFDNMTLVHIAFWHVYYTSFHGSLTEIAVYFV